MLRDVHREPLIDLYAALCVKEMVRDVNQEPLTGFYAALYV
jgi:hypothetical protein